VDARGVADFLTLADGVALGVTLGLGLGLTFAAEPPACAGTADAGMPNAEAEAQLAGSGTPGIGPGLALAGTVILGLL
jgi:hypothetical protein